MTIWISNYALAPKGIFTTEAEPEKNGTLVHRTYYSNGCIRCVERFGLEDIDWHRTRARAVARAEQMRAECIKRLRSEIAMLEAIDFHAQTETANA